MKVDAAVPDVMRELPSLVCRDGEIRRISRHTCFAPDAQARGQRLSVGGSDGPGDGYPVLGPVGLSPARRAVRLVELLDLRHALLGREQLGRRHHRQVRTPDEPS